MKKNLLIICALSIAIKGLCQNGKITVNTFDTPIFTLFSPMSFQKNGVTPASDTVPKLTTNPTGNILTMTQQSNCEGTSATFNNKFNPSKDWQLSFTYTLNTAGGTTTNADGIAVSIHNDSRGTAAVGGSGLSIGCEGSSGNNALCKDVTSTAIRNSVDWEFRVFGSTASLVRISNSGTVTTVGTSATTAAVTTGTPVNITLRYTASTTTLTVKFVSGSNTTNLSYTINIATYVGTSGYLAFTGGTGQLFSSQSISKVFMLGYML